MTAQDSGVCLDLCCSDLREVRAGLNVTLYLVTTFPILFIHLSWFSSSFLIMRVLSIFSYVLFPLCWFLSQSIPYSPSCYVIPSFFLLPFLLLILLPFRVFCPLLFILKDDCLWTWTLCPVLRCPASLIIKDRVCERDSPFALSPTRQANRRHSQIRIMRGTLAWTDWNDTHTGTWSHVCAHTHTIMAFQPSAYFSVCPSMFVCAHSSVICRTVAMISNWQSQFWLCLSVQILTDGEMQKKSTHC